MREVTFTPGWSSRAIASDLLRKNPMKTFLKYAIFSTCCIIATSLSAPGVIADSPDLRLHSRFLVIVQSIIFTLSIILFSDMIYNLKIILSHKRPSKPLLNQYYFVIAFQFIIASMLALIGFSSRNDLNTDLDCRVKCSHNIKAIAMAFAKYHERHGTIPSSYHQDSSKREPWQITLLPYLGHEKLYSQYNSNLPWDHPDNLKLLDQMPLVYSCPIARINSQSIINYVYNRLSLDRDLSFKSSYELIPEGKILSERITRDEDFRDVDNKSALLIENPQPSRFWLAPEIHSEDLFIKSTDSCHIVGSRSLLHVGFRDGSCDKLLLPRNLTLPARLLSDQEKH